MINVIDANIDHIRPNEQILNVGSDGDLESEKFPLDFNEILPSEGQAERDWYEQEAKRQEFEAAKSDRQGEEEAQAPQAVRTITSFIDRSGPGARTAWRVRPRTMHTASCKAIWQNQTSFECQWTIAFSQKV